jgi:putative hydrolase of HD superfamily
LITRGPFPLDAFEGKTISPLLRAFLQLNQLKQLFRQGWLRRGVPPARCETVAEHVFSMAMLAWWAADQFATALDRERVLFMTLAHELGEVYAGDIIPADGITTDEKHHMERESLEKVLAGLTSRDELITLWDEFEEAVTPEALFVRQLDRLEMAFQALSYAGQGYGPVGEFFQSAAAVVSDPDLARILEEAQLLSKKG